MGATSDWTVPSGDFALNADPEEKLGFAVKHALLASEEIRWPSWDYGIADGVAELAAKQNPLTEAMDQEGRETMIGCGVSLQFLKLTLRHLGCLGRVELFPNLDRPLLAARIHVGHGGERDTLESRLFAAIKRDHVPERLPDELLSMDGVQRFLGRAAEEERGWLEFARNATTRERLHTLTIRSQRLVVEEIRFRKKNPTELPSRERRSPRASDTSLFKRLSSWKKPQVVVKVGSSAAVSHGSDESNPAAALPGTFAVIKTKTDDRYGWLAAGQAMARVILQARVSGIPCALHNESLRSVRVRTALRSEIGRKGFVQAILRFRLESQPTSFESIAVCQPPPALRVPPPGQN